MNQNEIFLYFYRKGATTYDPTIVSRTQLLINSIYYDDMRKDPSDRSPGAIVTKPVGLLIHPEYNHQHNVKCFFLVNFMIFKQIKTNNLKIFQINASRTTT